MNTHLFADAPMHCSPVRIDGCQIRRCYVGTLHWPEFEVVFLISEMDSINDVTPLEFPQELRH